MKKRNSIGLLLTALGGLLGTLLIGLALNNTMGEWRAFQASRAAAEVNAAADQLLVAIERLTLERGLTNTALGADAAAVPTAVEAVHSRRQDMRTAMAAAWPMLANLRYLIEDGSVRKAEAAVAAIDALRQKADQAMPRPRSEREPAVHQQWYPVLSGGIEALTDVWQGATQRLSALDPQLAALNNMKLATASMREFTGRERALLGAGKPIDGQKRIEISDWRARADVAWEQITTVFPKDADARRYHRRHSRGEGAVLREIPSRARQGFPEPDGRHRSRTDGEGMGGHFQPGPQRDRWHSRCSDILRPRPPGAAHRLGP